MIWSLKYSIAKSHEVLQGYEKERSKLEQQRANLQARLDAAVEQHPQAAKTTTTRARNAAQGALITVRRLEYEYAGVQQKLRQAQKELSDARELAAERRRAAVKRVRPAPEPAPVRADPSPQRAALERRADAEERAEAKRRAAAAIVARAARAARGRGAKPAAAGVRQDAAAVHVKPEPQPEQPGPVRRRVAAKSAKAEPKQDSTQVKEEKVSVVVKIEEQDSEDVSEQPTRAKRARR